MLSIPIGSLVKTGLALLGKLGKGKATVTGLATVAAAALGAKAAPYIITDANIVALAQQACDFIRALGELVAAFGFGRKALDAAKPARDA